MSPVPRGDARRGEKHYRQISRRLGVPLIREVFGSFRRGETSAVSAVSAAERLGLGRTRFYELYTGYLHAAAQHQKERWIPGASGGDHAPDWPPGIEPLLRKLLSTRPPAPYRFAASEVHRRLGVRVDPASVRRWQCLKIGALWQLDATPHRWFPDNPKNYPLLDLLDECSHVCTGATIYHAGDLLAYFDFLSAAFTEHGLPLELYVDCHSLFFPQRPDSLTQLGAALHFYGISLRYARTPQAKGKIERQHQYWQGRLPALFAEAITTPEAAKRHSWPICAAIATPRRSTANSAAPPTPPQTRLGAKNAASCAPRRAALGGLMSGACAPGSKSAPTAGCPLARNASGPA